ncbi:hypothetical protein HY030_00370 [Candidatus Gottesmanbacteria bacterium]|nr:hypothetical protein [Candidatus Gottesmanbacteria bacterium]
MEKTTKPRKRTKKQGNKFLSGLFYGLIGAMSSLGLFLLFYWSLRLNASIDNLIRNFYGVPLYFWPYVILTIGTLVLFGINVPLLVYRFRKYGFPKLRSYTGGGLGAVIGVLASACPVCGSTLLSAIGVAGGLTVFPLQGLELKALSFGLMLVPFWLTTNELKLFQKGGKDCPLPKDPSFKKTMWPWLVLLLFLTVILASMAITMLKTDPAIVKLLAPRDIVNPRDNKINVLVNPKTSSKIYDEVVAKVLPEKGFQSKIALKDSVVKLVENRVIDRQKFKALYQERAGLPDDLKDVLDKPIDKAILLTRENANYYVNLLWPIGLANYMSTNKKSPILGDSLFNFASTGGWNLGKEKNGGAYFNKFKIVNLTSEQEALVTKIAQNTYRPCCDNSTFFQDCNHGSALLGLLQLGASQGLSKEELYKEALYFNSFWFPHNYIQTGLYFKIKKNIDWEKVNAMEVMGYNYSAGSQWRKNVASEIAKIPNLIPQKEGGGSCGT